MLDIYQLEQQITVHMQSEHVPGLALAIVKDQATIYARGFGVTSVEEGGVPVTPQTLFRIGSITKSLTGTAVMLLVESGLLDLDRPIINYLDWFTLSDQLAAERITLRMLLSHSSGLDTAAEHFGPRDPASLLACVRSDSPAFPLLFPPGTAWSYSNPGIILVGAILETISGQPYTQLMQKLVFDPLEMGHTTFDPLVAMTYAVAQSHDLHEDGLLHMQHHFAENTYHAPGGFALSTILDLSKFASMHLEHGRFRDRQFLTSESIAEMHRTQVAFDTTSSAGYGLTFFTDTYQGLRTVGHDGGISTFSSKLAMLPDANLAVIFTCNRMSNFPFMQFVHQIYDYFMLRT